MSPLTPFITRNTRMLLLACGLLSLALPCHADRKVRAIFIQPPGGSPEKAVLFSPAKSDEIELPTRNLSPEIPLPGGDLTLAVLTKAPAAGEKVNPEAPVVKIPEAWDRCILLFFPDPQNKAFPAKVIPVNASDAGFALGQTLIYNVTPATVVAKLGERVSQVGPGKSTVIPPPIAGFGSYPVAIDCTVPGNPEPAAICRSSWQHDPDARQILFVTPDPGRKVPRIWGVLDRSTPGADPN
jgi:hypothetical protein